jgi:hypothetical protein
MNRLSIITIICSVLLLNACGEKENQLRITVGEGVDKSRISIRKEVLGSILQTTVFDGHNQYPVPNGYGENEWYFSYRDSLKAVLGHLKTNQHDGHWYKFKFIKEGNRYFVDAKIEGVSDLHEKIELKPVSQ